MFLSLISLLFLCLLLNNSTLQAPTLERKSFVEAGLQHCSSAIGDLCSWDMSVLSSPKQSSQAVQVVP